jgi:peroxiredoxin
MKKIVLLFLTLISVSTMAQTDSLKTKLDEKKNNFLKKADKKKIEVYEAGIDSVNQSGVTKSAIQIGQRAPNFSLSNAKGDTVQLSKLLKQGPVILTWYRGGWCPYCNITLHSLQEYLPEFKKRGATLVALTPELPDNSLNTKEKNNLEFEVLSDVNSEVGKQYGIIYKLTKEVAEYYKKGVNLEKYNGEDSYTLPLAATYVINTNGIVTYAFLDADYRNRAEPAEIIEALEQLKK